MIAEMLDKLANVISGESPETAPSVALSTIARELSVVDTQMQRITEEVADARSNSGAAAEQAERGDGDSRWLQLDARIRRGETALQSLRLKRDELARQQGIVQATLDQRAREAEAAARAAETAEAAALLVAAGIAADAKMAEGVRATEAVCELFGRFRLLATRDGLKGVPGSLPLRAVLSGHLCSEKLMHALGTSYTMSLGLAVESGRPDFSDCVAFAAPASEPDQADDETNISREGTGDESIE
jgi:hypothetical protein